MKYLKTNRIYCTCSRKGRTRHLNMTFGIHILGDLILFLSKLCIDIFLKLVHSPQVLYPCEIGKLNNTNALSDVGSGTSSPKEFKETELDFASSENVIKNELTSRVITANDIVDIVHAHGYLVHEHVVKTKDGYLLSIHHIQGKETVSDSTSSVDKPVVYLHHGLLTNSELFVLGDTTSRCLPFRLIEEGYDVWLGNNRGNKYSQRHLKYTTKDDRFWNFSLDEFALFDIPDTINYILNVTGQTSLTYIGFSQGSSQAFAALSVNPDLNDKINLFIGLSPAMIPKGLNNETCGRLINTAPSMLYSLFGKRAIMPSVVFWQRILGPHLYERVVDASLSFLFNWNIENISTLQKIIGYPHMFSPTSVKSVVHWFQIIANRRFQMYDEGGCSGSKFVYLSGATERANRVAPFPTRNIKTPMLLIYGQSDMLIDMDKLCAQITSPLEVIGIPTYEHMDTLWARDVESAVFDKIIKRLKGYPKVYNKNNISI